MPIYTKTSPVREPSYILKDLDKAAEIALFYGFRPVKTPKIENIDIDQAGSLSSNKIDITKNVFPRPEEKISLLRNFLLWNTGNDSAPAMLHYKRPLSPLATKRPSDEKHYCLDIIGSPDSVSEAIAIKTASAILADHGHMQTIVDINSLGDKNSMNQFEKELVNFCRKHSVNMPNDVKQQLRKDPFETWQCDHEQWLEIRKKAPQTLNSLSEQSVSHFQQVLEYLETMDIPYRINHNLISQRQYCSHTVFEIKNITNESSAGGTNNPAPEETLAVGTRHNYLARKIGLKRDMAMMSVNIRFKKPSEIPKLFFKNKPNPKFFFIQFGSIAKLKSLPIIETLRQAKIPVHHMLTSDKFVGQLASAESLKTPFIIIMGQKEALENTVVVRHMITRSQDTVPVSLLPNYLNKIS